MDYWQVRSKANQVRFGLSSSKFTQIVGIGACGFMDDPSLVPVGTIPLLEELLQGCQPPSRSELHPRVFHPIPPTIASNHQFLHNVSYETSPI